MRARNAELLSADTFTTIMAAPTSDAPTVIGSPIAAGLAAVAAERETSKAAAHRDAARAAAAILAPGSASPDASGGSPEATAADDLLAALSAGHAPPNP